VFFLHGAGARVAGLLLMRIVPIVKGCGRQGAHGFPSAATLLARVIEKRRYLIEPTHMAAKVLA
jgi:hypothetical protein